MVGFWKFNVFVATLGAFMLALGVYGGLDHGFLFDKNVLNASVQFNFNPEAKGSLSAYIFLGGVLASVYVSAMTGLGLLVGFFGAPAKR